MAEERIRSLVGDNKGILVSKSLHQLPLMEWCHGGMFKCGQAQTMTHIVDSCPQTSLDGGLPRLHSADDYAITWLNSVAKEALVK